MMLFVKLGSHGKSSRIIVLHNNAVIAIVHATRYGCVFPSLEPPLPWQLTLNIMYAGLYDHISLAYSYTYVRRPI